MESKLDRSRSMRMAMESERTKPWYSQGFVGKIFIGVVSAAFAASLAWAGSQILRVQKVKSQTKKNKDQINRIEDQVDKIEKSTQRNEEAIYRKVVPTLKKIERQTSDETKN